MKKPRIFTKAFIPFAFLIVCRSIFAQTTPPSLPNEGHGIGENQPAGNGSPLTTAHLFC